MNFVPWIKQPGTADGIEGILASRDAALRDAVTHDPYLMRDMQQAVERIRKAIAENERILVYGDYDCDGVTSTVMLYDYLESAGADVLYYIPQRESEGYGLNMNAMEQIRAGGVNLVITVDNGVSAHEEIAYAASCGIDVIVTDHHQPREKLPECVAVINPHRTDCGYPFKELCGAGVAFKLISALENDSEGLMFELYGDLLAIGTTADIVPLVGENRYMVQMGLETLKNTERVGLIALAKVAGLELDSITAERISFVIAPRINATGRISSVDTAVELLLTPDEQEAEKLAGEIDALNKSRKEIETAIMSDIEALIAKNPAMLYSRVLVVCGEGWHPGVIGITAARLVERYGKPSIVLTSIHGGELRGSARSVRGFSIIAAIDACGSSLIKYGGHAMAAGLSLSSDMYEAFCREIEAYSARLYLQMPRYSLAVDGEVELCELTLQNALRLEQLQPFGFGNSQPVPTLCGVTLAAVAPIGDGSHVRLTLSKGGAKIDAALFGVSVQNYPIPVGTEVDCAITMSRREWQGEQRLSVRLLSVRPHGFDIEQKLLGLSNYESFCRGEETDAQYREQCSFCRDDLSMVFRLLRELSPWSGGEDWLLFRLGARYGQFRLSAALAILLELGLIERKGCENGGFAYTVLPAKGKSDICSAPTYKKLMSMGLAQMPQAI